MKLGGFSTLNFIPPKHSILRQLQTIYHQVSYYHRSYQISLILPIQQRQSYSQSTMVQRRTE